MKNRSYIDIHCLQTVPASCVNRDDNGSPKTCIYGGVQRARVSSQAWKKAIRDSFKENLPAEDQGVRTKKVIDMVTEEILQLDPEMKPEKAAEAAKTAFTNAGVKIKDSKDETDALFLLGQKQAAELAKLALSDLSKKEAEKACKEVLKKYPSVDMALFGRMVAGEASLNYDAASQVAHAFSTHKVMNEFDYFTAVDDLSPEDSAGAGHIGMNEFNSSTLYRYATVNFEELYRHLGTKAPEAVAAFVSGFLRSMPTGKMNTFANRTLPSSVYIAIRKDQPVSMAGAYEKAVSKGSAEQGGYEETSQKRLVEYAQELYKDFVNEPDQAYVTGKGLDDLGVHLSLNEMLNELKEQLIKMLPAGEE